MRKRKRDVIKQAVRLYTRFDGPDWEEAAAQVGLTLADIQRWQRRPEWPEICEEVAAERLTIGLPIAVGRLLDAARADKSSSGVTASRTLIDITRPNPGEPAEGIDEESGVGDEIDFAKLTKEERELACRIFARLRRRGPDR
jgi:hypothetical protein